MEEQTVLQLPITVQLGGKDYDIRPLPLKYSLPWCKKMAKLLTSGMDQLNVKADDSRAFEKALQNILSDRPEQAIELFFEYARDLPREEIEETASINDILDALDRIKGELEGRFFGWTVKSWSRTLKAE